MAFQPKDFVFAKVKGYPPWPARIQSVLDRKPSKNGLRAFRYNVIFYGTYQRGCVPETNVVPYTLESKERNVVGIKQRRGYNIAIEHIEQDMKANDCWFEEYSVPPPSKIIQEVKPKPKLKITIPEMIVCKNLVIKLSRVDEIFPCLKAAILDTYSSTEYDSDSDTEIKISDIDKQEDILTTNISNIKIKDEPDNDRDYGIGLRYSQVDIKQVPGTLLQPKQEPEDVKEGIFEPSHDSCTWLSDEDKSKDDDTSSLNGEDSISTDDYDDEFEISYYQSEKMKDVNLKSPNATQSKNCKRKPQPSGRRKQQLKPTLESKQTDVDKDAVKVASKILTCSGCHLRSLSGIFMALHEQECTSFKSQGVMDFDSVNLMYYPCSICSEKCMTVESYKKHMIYHKQQDVKINLAVASKTKLKKKSAKVLMPVNSNNSLTKSKEIESLNNAQLTKSLVDFNVSNIISSVINEMCTSQSALTNKQTEKVSDGLVKALPVDEDSDEATISAPNSVLQQDGAESVPGEPVDLDDTITEECVTTNEEQPTAEQNSTLGVILLQALTSQQSHYQVIEGDHVQQNSSPVCEGSVDLAVPEVSENNPDAESCNNECNCEVYVTPVSPCESNLNLGQKESTESDQRVGKQVPTVEPGGSKEVEVITLDDDEDENEKTDNLDTELVVGPQQFENSVMPVKDRVVDLHIPEVGLSGNIFSHCVQDNTLVGDSIAMGNDLIINDQTEVVFMEDLQQNELLELASNGGVQVPDAPPNDESVFVFKNYTPNEITGVVVLTGGNKDGEEQSEVLESPIEEEQEPTTQSTMGSDVYFFNPKINIQTKTMQIENTPVKFYNINLLRKKIPLHHSWPNPPVEQKGQTQRLSPPQPVSRPKTISLPLPQTIADLRSQTSFIRKQLLPPPALISRPKSPTNSNATKSTAPQSIDLSKSPIETKSLLSPQTSRSKISTNSVNTKSPLPALLRHQNPTKLLKTKLLVSPQQVTPMTPKKLIKKLSPSPDSMKATNIINLNLLSKKSSIVELNDLRDSMEKNVVKMSVPDKVLTLIDEQYQQLQDTDGTPENNLKKKRVKRFLLIKTQSDPIREDPLVLLTNKDLDQINTRPLIDNLKNKWTPDNETDTVVGTQEPSSLKTIGNQDLGFDGSSKTTSSKDLDRIETHSLINKLKRKLDLGINSESELIEIEVQGDGKMRCLDVEQVVDSSETMSTDLQTEDDEPPNGSIKLKDRYNVNKILAALDKLPSEDDVQPDTILSRLLLDRQNKKMLPTTSTNTDVVDNSETATQQSSNTTLEGDDDDDDIVEVYSNLVNNNPLS